MNKYLPILIISIFADVVCNNSVIRVFDIQVHHSALTLTTIMLILQMLTAPIQAGFSDFYCRKKSLVVALSCSFLSLLLFSFAKSPGLLALIFLYSGLIINSCLGNIVPIAWSALADVQEKNLRFFLALTTSAYAVGYMILALLNNTTVQLKSEASWLWQDILMPLVLLGFSIILIWKFYRDKNDKKSSNEKIECIKLARSETTALMEEMRHPRTRFGLLAYFLWAVSQYSPLLVLINSEKYTATVIIMMFGYLIGAALLGFLGKIRDESIIKIAFIITILSLVVFFVLLPFTKQDIILLSICGFFYTLANAFLTPSIFSLFSKEREIHEQGKGFGLIVSADSAGFLIAIIAERGMNYFKIRFEYMILFSLLVFIISWFPYSAYEKIRKNVPKIF